MTDPVSNQLLDAALMHVPFDGWSETTFRAAIADTEMNDTVARGLFPRGAIDLAIAYHKRGDAAMLERIDAAALGDMRFRDKVTFAVRARIEVVTDREAVRRGTTLFALPIYAADGAKLIWNTADAIWTALGDTSTDINWYSKRATLSAVYSSTVLFWLGDDSVDNQATWAFLDRRIEDVMRVEKMKAQVGKSPLLSKFLAGPAQLMSRVQAPKEDKGGLPGRWNAPSNPPVDGV